MTTRLYIRICEFLKDKIAGTCWQGHVYTVGGCCRDMALGAEIKDVDLAVDLPSGGVEFALWLFHQRLTVGHPVLFEKYGTAMLRLRAFPHEEIEIVQTRAEKYTDRNSRNPETAFGSIKDDCLRRDLTINALYYNITDEKLLDITGRSLSDINNKIIATPLDPDSTYDDDPIRILRTIRFACRLGWDLPKPVMDAMSRNSSRLNIIKAERMRGEFEKILLGAHAGRAIEMMLKCGALKMVVPAVEACINKKYIEGCDDTVWLHITRTIDLLPADLTLRWSCLLFGCNSSHDVMKSLLLLKYHQPLLKDVVFLCARVDYTLSWGKYAEKMTDSNLRRLQYICGRSDKIEALLTLIDAFNCTLPADYAMPKQVAAIRFRNEQLHKQGTEMYEYHLPFAERRIKKILHIEPGPLVEDTLEYMMELAFANPNRSRSEFEKLVGGYTPKVPSADKVLLANEIRPSAKQPRGRKLNSNRRHENTDAAKGNKVQSQKSRRHHHRRRKKSTTPKE